MTISVRNNGAAWLPAGVQVDIFRLGDPEELLGSVTTSKPLMPGQTDVVAFTAPDGATTADAFQARIFIDPNAPQFNECRDDNNESPSVTAGCLH